MAITHWCPRIVIQQGTSAGAVFAFRATDKVTSVNLSDWSATFEIFDANGVSLHKFDSATSANVDTGLWLGTGEPIAGPTTDMSAYTAYVEIPKAVTSSMTDWGIGHFDLDLIDPFGHVQARAHGECVLEEGTKHV